MAEQMRQGFCQECGKYTLVKRKGVSHILHLLLSIFTIGFWVLVWIALALLNIGGWRCQTCGSDKIKDTGEMLSLRGWLVIVVMALLFLPMAVLFSGGPEAGSTMAALTPLLVWVPLAAIPVMIFLAFRRRSRQQQRLSRSQQPTEPVMQPSPVSRPSAESQPTRANTPSGMIVSEEYFERGETDTTAADEFRRRVQQADNSDNKRQ